MERYEKSYEHDGVCVAKIILVTPHFDTESRMSVFYRSLAEKSKAWFEEKRIPAAIEKYESSDDERKKWRWTPTVFCINCKNFDKDNQRSFVLDISLSDSDGSLKEQRIHRWDLVRDRICKMNVKKLSIANID
ncbi:MAG: hypothetical protein IJC50_01765 [Clostridia bacterium]|nr:hypothetical protein [Clostridia bacterium]